ncbi:PREDICTED: RING-H2 finger protein ATL63-like [Ipomoea nil]|uniref:RING-H2 finger protein ATL63-like n=1 Tax=Ipomoea nil TaxID=35883 RepID=UPI000900ECB8|nr:PREDICTED: RING-H2 finger protein ATL63-like [Ipomoea nil]
MPTLHTPPLPPITVVSSSREDSDDPVKGMIHSMLSYDGNVMLAAAVISLLLVILFVLLLHLYAKWFLTQARHPSGSSVAVPQVWGAAGGFSPHFHAFRVEVERAFRNSPAKKHKGLAQSVISSIPVFAYKGMGKEDGNGFECSICLSGFEDGEMGRKLPKCRHAFHAECIDMWLYSQSSCPICRAPVTPPEITYTSSPPGDDRNSDGWRHTPLQIMVEVPNEENTVNDDRNERFSGSRRPSFSSGAGAGDL